MLSYLRTVILYSVLILVIRLMGKRQVGQMEPSEFVVAMLVADLASIPMQNDGIPLISGLIPIFTVLGLELVLSHLSLKSIRLRQILCGKPVILIEKGKILQKNLQNARVTLDELTGHLREKDVLDISAVQFAILETNGNLSVFPFPEEKPACARDAGLTVQKQALPFTIVSDGILLHENLKKAGKDAKWLEKTLKKEKSCLKDTFLLTVDEGGNTFFCRKEL